MIDGLACVELKETVSLSLRGCGYRLVGLDCSKAAGVPCKVRASWGLDAHVHDLNFTVLLKAEVLHSVFLLETDPADLQIE